MVEKLIKKIVQKLDEDKVPYMVIGGQALLVYGRPRLTQDIDITLGIDTDDFAIVEKMCKKLKLDILPENPEDFAKQTRALPAEEPKSKIRVDFIFSFSEYEQQAIKRTRPVDIDDYPVRFASCEDVIIHKMVAGRAIDEEDVKSILIRQGGRIDLGYVKDWLEKFEVMPEFAGVGNKFEKLLEH